MARALDPVHAFVHGGAAELARVGEVVRASGREIVHVDAAGLAAKLGEMRVLLCGARGPAGFDWSRARDLRLLQILGSGTDWLWPADGLPVQTAIANARGIHLPEMRDHALAMMFAFARRLPTWLDQQRRREWRPIPTGAVGGKTAGILGLGEVGRAIARACHALGMRVVGTRHDPRLTEGVDEVMGPDGLDRLLGESDFVTVALPLTARTRGLLDARAIARLRPGAVLVVLSRGKIVDQAALEAALRSGALGGAALDVFQEEPLPPASTLWTAPNLIVTPHMAGLVPDYLERALRVFLENLELVERGLPPRTSVRRDREY